MLDEKITMNNDKGIKKSQAAIPDPTISFIKKNTAALRSREDCNALNKQTCFDHCKHFCI